LNPLEEVVPLTEHDVLDSRLSPQRSGAQALQERDAQLATIRSYLNSHDSRSLGEYAQGFRDGRLLLRGVANCFHVKQLAQYWAARAPGVTRIENQIVVMYPPLGSLGD
jgi:hypothetical protein